MYLLGAQITDEGVYTCVLENRFGHISFDGRVIITGAGELYFLCIN